MVQFQSLTAYLIDSRPLSDYTRHLEFEVKGASRFGFVAGQWLSVKQTRPDGEEITRAYSIASPPDLGPGHSQGSGCGAPPQLPDFRASRLDGSQAGG